MVRAGATFPKQQGCLWRLCCSGWNTRGEGVAMILPILSQNSRVLLVEGGHLLSELQSHVQFVLVLPWAHFPLYSQHSTEYPCTSFGEHSPTDDHSYPTSGNLFNSQDCLPTLRYFHPSKQIKQFLSIEIPLTGMSPEISFLL